MFTTTLLVTFIAVTATCVSRIFFTIVAGDDRTAEPNPFLMTHHPIKFQSRRNRTFKFLLAEY
jgi:hypothetical protein